MCISSSMSLEALLEKAGEKLLENAPEIFSGEPKEVRELRKQEIAGTDEQSGRQEYYFGLLTEEEQRGYREMLDRDPEPGEGILPYGL